MLRSTAVADEEDAGVLDTPIGIEQHRPDRADIRSAGLADELGQPARIDDLDIVVQEQHVLRLDVQGERVVGYYRPLVEKDQKMNAGSKKMLPSGPALVQYLKNEQIPFDDIERLFIGYKGQMSDHYMLYEPHWIIELIDGRRLFLQNIPDTGGGQA